MKYTVKEFDRHMRLLKRLRKKIGNPDAFEIQPDNAVKIRYAEVVKMFHMKQRIDVFVNDLMEEVHGSELKEELRNGLQPAQQQSLH